MSRGGFLARLRSGPLLADGAMGTLLYSMGVGYEQSFDALSESRPELVRQVHERYIAAGARLIETNSFGANALRLAEHGLTPRVRAINLAAARLARACADAAQGDEAVWVAGSVGPLGAGLQPLGPLGTAEAGAAYGAQIAALAEGGVDLILIETQRDLAEARLALEAARRHAALPVVVLLTFGEDGLTPAGQDPATVARILLADGADLVGANCSTGPAQMLPVVARMADAAGGIVAAMPNAGLPSVVDGRYVYAASPAYMAEAIVDMVAAGARLVGGCCGTTPEHCLAMQQALARREPAARLPSAWSGGLPTAERPADAQADTGPGPTSFEAALRQGFTVCVEVQPPRSFSAASLLPDLAGLLEGQPVQAFCVSDSPRARPHASPLAMGALIAARLGRPAVLTLSCRHRNLVALHADLMGAHALDLRDVLPVMGGLPAQGDYPNATVVHDVTDLQLLRLLQAFNRGEDGSGRPLDQPTAFHAGCRFRFGALDLGREIEAFLAKVEAGAAFALSDPLFDLARFHAVESALGGRFPIPVLVGVLPLDGPRHGAFLHHEVPGMEIPAELLARLREAGEERGAEQGLDIAAETLEALGDRVQGAFVLPPFGRYAVVPRLLERLNLPRPALEAPRP